MTKKYFIWLKDNGRLNVNGRQTAMNIPVIRYADVLLMAAELEVRVGSIANAFEYVNRIRNRMRANAASEFHWVKKYKDDSDPSLGFTNEHAANYKIEPYPVSGGFPFDNPANALKAILFERLLELGLEGHRSYDLIRFGMASDITTDWDTKEFEAYLKYESQRRTYLANGKYEKIPDRWMPIPQQVQDASVQDGVIVLKQNPGY